MIFPLVITLLVGYMLGNLNGAVCMSSMMGDDVRTHGSGNAGLTNFIRNYGVGRAVYVVLVDAGKAVLACMAGGLLLDSYLGYTAGAALGGLAVMLGHDFPALLGFKGGKGILSGLFVALVVDWRVAVIILAVFALFYLTTRYVSLGSVLAALAFSVSFGVLQYRDPIVMACGIVMGLLAVWMHRKNILLLLTGKERKTDLFKKSK